MTRIVMKNGFLIIKVEIIEGGMETIILLLIGKMTESH